MSAVSTDETAVMLDTFAPLQLGSTVAGIEDPGYAWSWARGCGKAGGGDAHDGR